MTSHQHAAPSLPAFTFANEAATHAVRIVRSEDGQVWWVAKDVCDALGIANSSRALSRVEACEKGATKLYTPGGLQTFATVNQSGLFALAFQSRKQGARAFRQWVTGTVLPAIYRDGAYIRGEERLLAAATPEELRERLAELEATAVQAVEAKVRRGLCGLEERDARRGAFQLIRTGRMVQPVGKPGDVA